MDTTIGRLENLKIPRDREGRFRTKLIEPYKRRDMDLEDLILGMFASGMSLRSVSQALESIFELKYSPSTISQISQITEEEINSWKKRKLKKVHTYNARWHVAICQKEHYSKRGCPLCFRDR